MARKPPRADKASSCNLCSMWHFLLLAGDFMTDMQQRMKQEEERQAKLDPWKVILPFPLLPSHHHHHRRRHHHHQFIIFCLFLFIK